MSVVLLMKLEQSIFSHMHESKTPRTIDHDKTWQYYLCEYLRQQTSKSYHYITVCKQNPCH